MFATLVLLILSGAVVLGEHEVFLNYLTLKSSKNILNIYRMSPISTILNVRVTLITAGRQPAF